MDKSELNKSSTQKITPIQKNDSIPFITENLNTIKTIFIVSCITAILMTILFAGSKVGYIGLLIFTLLESLILFFTSKKLDLIKNKSAFYLFIPINLIALSNALFYTNYTFLNILAVHLLFSLFLTKVTNISFRNFFDLDLYLRSFTNFLPNYALAVKSFLGFFTKKENTDKPSKSNDYLLGVVFAIPILTIVIVLLATADENFSNIFDTLFDLNFSMNLYYIIYFVIASFVLFGYGLKIFFKRDKEVTIYNKLNFNHALASSFLLALNIVYVLFLFYQIKYTITDGFFALPTGFEYYDYAYRGFYPTFIVTLINISIVLFMTEFTNITFKDKFFNANFFLIFISNILLIFNSINRMYIYILEYGYTTDRLSATLFLFFELVAMILLIFKFKKNINFYKLVFISFLITYIIQAFTCNDYISTALNFNKFNVTENDTFYGSYDYSFYGETDETLYNGAYLHVKGKDDSFSFRLTDDSLAYILHYTNDNDIENFFIKSYHDDPFYSKTFLEIIMENEFLK